MKKPKQRQMLDRPQTEGQIWDNAERVNKDDRAFKIGVYQPNTYKKIKEYQLKFGFPTKKDFKVLDQMFPTTDYEYEFYKKAYKHLDRKINKAVNELLFIANLSDRFRDSVKSFLMYGKAILPHPPVQFFFIKKQLTIRIYSDVVLKDIEQYWHNIFEYQTKAQPTPRKIRYKFLNGCKINGYIDLELYANTLLSNLDKKFRTTLESKFKRLGFTKKNQSYWSYKKTLELLALDEIEKDDSTKADLLFGDDTQRAKIRRLRNNSKKYIKAK